MKLRVAHAPRPAPDTVGRLPVASRRQDFRLGFFQLAFGFLLCLPQDAGASPSRREVAAGQDDRQSLSRPRQAADREDHILAQRLEVAVHGREKIPRDDLAVSKLLSRYKMLCGLCGSVVKTGSTASHVDHVGSL
jgi:hypothetical protein